MLRQKALFTVTLKRSNSFLIGQRYRQSTWGNVPQAPPDKILGLKDLFQADDNPNKIDLGVGAYRDNNGNPWIPLSVRHAENILYNTEKEKEYSPILGNNTFITCVQRLLFSQDAYGRRLLNDGRIATAQGLSGTGSLKILAEFLRRFNPEGPVMLPDPTWANHKSIMQYSGLRTETYRYYDCNKKSINIEGMLDDINMCKPGTVILIHLCCHNPTGADLKLEDWHKVIEILHHKELIPFFDSAYLGLCSGDPIKDLKPLFMVNKAVVERHLPTYLLAQSFAKNMGLYGERVGSFSIICSDKSEKQRVNSQLAQIVRSTYSSPPCHGSKLVSIILSNENLYSEWLTDIKTMAERLNSVRIMLFESLTNKYHSDVDWSHLLTQRGMFCLSGLTRQQVQRLRSERSIYMTPDGRISLAGINSSNLDYLARSICDVTSKKITLH